MSDEVKDALRAALATAVIAFVTLFGGAAVGFLNDVLAWAQEGAAFPDASVLAKAAVAGIASAGIGVVNFAVRFAQQKVSWLNSLVSKLIGRAPSYDYEVVDVDGPAALR